MKPAKKRKCPKKLCGFSSCQDVKKKGASQGDGEYPILLGGRNISVFCHQMASNWPKEFLSLPKGEQENYSEVYGMRLLSPNSCPNNGSREPDCPCVRDDSPRAGNHHHHHFQVLGCQCHAHLLVQAIVIIFVAVFLNIVLTTTSWRRYDRVDQDPAEHHRALRQLLRLHLRSQAAWRGWIRIEDELKIEL